MTMLADPFNFTSAETKRAIIAFLAYAQENTDIFDPVMIEATGKMDAETIELTVAGWQESLDLASCEVKGK